MSIKLVALDLDGTTLDPDSKITPYTEKVLKAAMDQGVHILVATGRAFEAVPEEVKNMEGIEYVVTSNGAATIRLADRKIIYTNYIKSEAMDEVHEVLADCGFLVEIFIEGRAYVDSYWMEHLDDTGLSELTKEYVRQTRNPVDGLMELMMKNRGKIENINVCFGDPKDREAMKQKLFKLKGVTITSSVPHNLEIIAEKAGKGQAVRHMCQLLNLYEDQVMACGDSSNDEDMIHVAGIGVAMGNAKESLKAVADYVTESNAEDGVAKAILKFAKVKL